MKNLITLVSITFFSFLGADQSLDTEFLEWLGQTAEIEELGVNVDSLIQEREKPKQLGQEPRPTEAEQ